MNMRKSILARSQSIMCGSFWECALTKSGGDLMRILSALQISLDNYASCLRPLQSGVQLGRIPQSVCSDSQVQSHLYREHSAAILSSYSISDRAVYYTCARWSFGWTFESLGLRGLRAVCASRSPVAASKLWGRGAKIRHVLCSRPMHRLESGEQCSRAYLLRGYASDPVAHKPLPWSWKQCS